MEIGTRARALLKRAGGVAWFVLGNPFLIIRKVVYWGLVAFFWLFIIGWITTAFAAEWTPAQKKDIPSETTPGQCKRHINVGFVPASSFQDCVARTIDYLLSISGDKYTFKSSYTGSYDATQMKVVGVLQNGGYTKEAVFVTSNFASQYVCPPDGKPDFTVGPKTLNGQQVCEKKPVSCNVGEQLFMDSTTGAETCKPNCASVAGQKLENVAYNQAFLPSATVSCFGLCTVSSSGLTVGNPKTFEQFGNVQFTGEACPVKFPAEGNGNVIGANPPASSADTAAALAQLQNAASAASGSPVSGATGTATLNDVVNKVAETSNKQVKAMSDQNAALGKVLEGVGKDIQGAIKDSAQGTAAGSSIGQLQTANAIKDGNKTLNEIKDKLDKPQDPKPPVLPSTDLGSKPSDIHKGNNWETRNFSTVLANHASRMGDLPIFSTPTKFFKFETGGASCPVYHGNFTILGYATSFSLESFCDPAIINLFPYLRGVILLVFGFFAWRIAVGNWG